MQETMNYKGYQGTIEYSLEDNVLHGRVLGIKSILSYEGNTLLELKKDFESLIDEYLEDCKNNNESPEKPYKQNIVINLEPDLQEKLYLYSALHNENIIDSIGKAIRNLVTG
ncbi:type II toxin-antitoxin system HicB family antitoxin [Ligilactobacillus salivarius]|uniref:type II toxin-antitoxin system HicB family antitoxin n=1 Tax=Ligilactobacillus salivarius TaxID=1624 RepID=UPI00296729FB|nr:type II toxin-antitoxin system HicB family antitoxin [Ligilactobacillus salivarius]MDW3022879.1 type II toxin-antitoxin system HicB family antitoxin [Ligilactobacillus salivarius]